MLILLDCRPLQQAGSDSEKIRLIVSAIVALSGDPAVEWLFLVDHSYRDGMLPDLDGLLHAQPGLLSAQSGLLSAQSGLLSARPGCISAEPGVLATDPSSLSTQPDVLAAEQGPIRARLLTARGLPGPLGWKLWYDWQLPRLAKRYQPDLVMLTGGVAARPLVARQHLWMPVHANPKEAAAKTEATIPIYAARLGNSVRQAEKIFCFSEKDRSWLAGRGHIDAGNILVMRPSPSPTVHPLRIDEKEAIKQRYTGGKEYFFIAAGTIAEDDMIQLLKAFSLFKKRQLSNLQLMITGTQPGALQQRLATYKYRGDVHWADAAANVSTADAAANAPAAGAANPATGAAADAGELMAAAYAAIFPFVDGSLGSSLLNAWKSGVPTLVARHSTVAEMADAAMLIADIDDPAALAGYMMSVYKDEMLRNALIEKGKSRLASFDPSPSLAAIRTAADRETKKIN